MSKTIKFTPLEDKVVRIKLRTGKSGWPLAPSGLVISYIPTGFDQLPTQWFYSDYQGGVTGPFISSGQAIYEFYNYVMDKHRDYHDDPGEGGWVHYKGNRIPPVYKGRPLKLYV